MSAARPNSPSPLATEIAFRFVREWQSGRQPRIEDAILSAPPSEWDTLLHSLLIAEVNARRGGGEAPQLAEYLARFPHNIDIVRSVFPQEPVAGPAASAHSAHPVVPVAQFLQATPSVEPAEPEPTSATTVPQVFESPPSTKPIWLLLVGGGLLAVAACVAVIVIVLPTPKPTTEPVVAKNEPNVPAKAKEEPKKAVDPERDTAEWILKVGGRGVLQSSKGRISLGADVELPKGTFTIEGVTLPEQSANQWNEADLERFRWREKLTQVNLSHPSALTDKGLSNFTKHPLKSLELRGAEVLITGATLRALPTLEQLTLLTAPRFGDADMAALATLDKLNTLKISSPKITANGMAHLKNLALLRSLTLGADCTLTADHIRLMQTVPLEELTSLGGMTDDVFSECAVFLNLKRCHLQQTSLTDGGFKAIAGMRKLEEVRVLGSQIGSEGFKLLHEIQTLQIIELRGAKVMSAGLEGIDQLVALKELRLAGSPITDAGVSTIANIETLQILDLSDCPVTDQTLNILNKHAALKTLFLQRTNVSPKGIEVFRKANPKITVVWK